MLKIRLQRVGRRNHAEFRVVVTQSTKGPKSANYIENLGHYNPHTNAVTFVTERVEHWMKVGAQVSGTVHNLLVTKGIVKGKKINVLPKKTAPKKEEAAPVVAKETEVSKVEVPEVASV
jgi:small subunit ribosomal protein S16